MQWKSTDKYCRDHIYEHAKPIKKESETRKAEKPIYSRDRKTFLALPENQFCFIDGCGQRATTIEHTMGRKGYADDWARDQKITLFVDVRFWKPCCLFHNGELERNPELSKRYQVSKIHGGQKM